MMRKIMSSDDDDDDDGDGNVNGDDVNAIDDEQPLKSQ